jgi:hypothetical protein
MFRHYQRLQYDLRVLYNLDLLQLMNLENLLYYPLLVHFSSFLVYLHLKLKFLQLLIFKLVISLNYVVNIKII